MSDNDRTSVKIDLGSRIRPIILPGGVLSSAARRLVKPDAELKRSVKRIAGAGTGAHTNKSRDIVRNVIIRLPPGQRAVARWQLEQRRQQAVVGDMAAAAAALVN